jgi:hypothetical protein
LPLCSPIANSSHARFAVEYATHKPSASFANLSALVQPFAAGRKICVQGWHRDPPSPNSTNLANALELTLFP